MSCRSWVVVAALLAVWGVGVEAQVITMRLHDASMRLVPGPPTTQMFIVITADPGPCAPLLPTERTGNQIDLLFTSALCGTPLPGHAVNWFYGYMPAGTYTVRHIYEPPPDAGGARRVLATFQFEVLEAGRPLHIPTMSTMSLIAMAVALLLVAMRVLR